MEALVVDDSRAMRMLLCGLLGELGFVTRDAENGRTALGVLDDGKHPPAVVLVDWNMPEMNGLELITAIRERECYSDLPLLVVTSETGVSEMRAALDAGANEYLVKPFSREELAARLELAGVSAG